MTHKTHKTVRVAERKAGDAFRRYAPVVQTAVQEKGGEALKRTILVLGEGLLLAVVASATVLTFLVGAYRRRADEGGSR
jgi:hypothetical protein